MKIAVPLQNGRFCSHFGGAEEFALFGVDPFDRGIASRDTGAPPEHGRGVYPMWLQRQGATVVLAGGMGPRAIGILAQHGIEVVLGVEGDDPEDLVQRYLNGTLEATGQPCRDHGFHDCNHHGH
jgi:predicted Fe-Mo cluster-binding NifX family protein